MPEPVGRWIDRALHRYLAEAVWVPSALLPVETPRAATRLDGDRCVCRALAMVTTRPAFTPRRAGAASAKGSRLCRERAVSAWQCARLPG